MSGLLTRPLAQFDPARGLLRNEHFQVCYTTHDLTRACDIFSRRFGIGKFGGLEGETPAGGYIKVKLAWVGSTMYELVECTGPGSEMYTRMLPESAFGLCHHHLGFLVHSLAAWDDLMTVIARDGWQVSQQNNNRGFMRHCYIHVPELGHYFEYIFPEQAGIDFFENVPAN